MFRNLISRAFSRSSEKSSVGTRKRTTRPVVERLEDRQLMCGTVCGDYVAGFGIDSFCGTKVNMGNHYGPHKLTGAI
jgi:hypothetical protein